MGTFFNVRGFVRTPEPPWLRTWIVCRSVAFLHIPLTLIHNPQVLPPSSRSGFDLRKARSRDAARFRRGRENFEFLELARLLPLHEEIAGQLDKASVVRLAVSYLKLRHFCESGDPSWTTDRRTAFLDAKRGK